MRDTSQKTELSSGGRAPCSTGFPHQVSILGTYPYQCTSWRCCERLRLASVTLFWRLFQHICPFRDGWFTSVPAHTVLSVQQFLSKNGITLVPHPSYSPDLPRISWSDSFVSLDEKSPHGETFCWCGRGETKNSRSTERHQNRWIQELFWAVERSLDICITPNGEYFKGDWSLNMYE